MASLKTDPAHYITAGGKRLPLIIRKHPRARNLVVRYDAGNDTVRVSVPRYVSIKSAVEFAISKTAWIEKQLEKRERIAFEDGAILPLWGKEVTLKYVGGRGITHLEEIAIAEIAIPTEQGEARSGGVWGEGPQRTKCILKVTGAAESMKRRVRDYIAKEMKNKTEILAAKYAAQLGVTISSIRIGDTRSRWGSCSSKGVLSFSLRLAFAPAEVLDYVVCHEVCHRKHLNHSPHYWQTVESLCASYQQHETWLSKHGHSVWNYG